jgi:hypothetical protein
LASFGAPSLRDELHALAGPGPYPYRLLLLSEGKLTVKGFRELFACDYEPLPGWATLKRAKIILKTTGDTRK